MSNKMLIYRNNEIKICKGNDEDFLLDTEECLLSSQTKNLAEAFHIAYELNMRFDYDEATDNEVISLLNHLGAIVYAPQYERKVLDYYQTIYDKGFGKITNDKHEPMQLARQTLSNIIDDYNKSLNLYNFEAYGFDTYIAKILQNIVTDYGMHSVIDIGESIADKEDKYRYKLALNLCSEEYDLDKVVDILKEYNSEDIDAIEIFKKDFIEDYNISAEAIEDYIDVIVTFARDSNQKIFKAMIEAIEDIKADEQLRKEMSDYLINGGLVWH